MSSIASVGRFDQTPQQQQFNNFSNSTIIGNGFGSGTATTSTTATYDNNVDGLLVGTHWASTSISFSFTDSFNDYESGYPDSSSHSSSYQSLNNTQRAIAREWLTRHFYNVSFVSPYELTGTSDRDATIRMAMSNNPSTAFGYYPWSSVEAGDIWFNRSDYNSPVIGDYAYHTFGHEIGHAMGLKHGHETWGVRNVSMNADRDSMEFSIMTYRSYVGHNLTALPYYTNETYGYAQSLMMYDIRAIQQMYGPWFGYNSGNTNYTFSTTTGQMFVNGIGQGTPGANRVFRTIWDGNGIDTYDFSNYTTNLAVDLTPGGWTNLHVGGNFQRAALNNGYGGIYQYARGHVFNALQYNGDARSLIENARGGSGNDSITGNSANNSLWGNNGNDTINGGSGDDYMDGGAGIDTIDYAYWSGGGTYNLATGVASFPGFYDEEILNFENILTGAGNDLIIGSAFNNVITAGGGNDTVDGGNGNDIIYFGDGDDYLNNLSLGNDTYYGGLGNDFIYGYTGNEVYYGEAENDTLKGYSGNDLINGGIGNDILTGGLGTDTLTGGVGGINSDWFVFDTGFTFNAATIGIDVLTDFTPGLDRIVLDRTTFTALTGSLTFAIVSNITQAQTNSALFTYIRPLGSLFYNQNGVLAGLGTGGQFADLTDNLLIGTANFLVQA